MYAVRVCVQSRSNVRLKIKAKERFRGYIVYTKTSEMDFVLSMQDFRVEHKALRARRSTWYIVLSVIIDEGRYFLMRRGNGLGRSAL